MFHLQLTPVAYKSLNYLTNFVRPGVPIGAHFQLQSPVDAHSDPPYQPVDEIGLG